MVLLESLLIILPLFTYKFFTAESLINFIFISLLCTLFIFRSRNIRHMYFGLIFLIFSMVGNILGFENLVYITSSITISLYILGVLNMMLFYSEYE